MIATIIFIMGALLFFGAAIVNLIRRLKKQTKYKYAVSFKKTFGKSKVPLIKLKLGDNFYYFLIDSGSQMNVLDKSFFSILPENIRKNIKRSTHNVAGALASDENPRLEHDIDLDLSIGRNTFPKIDFTIRDIRGPISIMEQNLKLPIAGLLGAPFLNQYEWQVDFDELVIWINKV